MEQPRQVLRSLMIPFQGGYAVLPNSSVMQVLPFATPLHMEGAPPWVVGAMLWQARTTPLVSLGRLTGEDEFEPKAQAHARIIVVNALGNDPKLLNYGLLATDVPHPLNDLQRSSIVADEQADEPVPPGVLRRVRVNGQPAMIPDMDAIEAALVRLMRA